MLHGLSLTGIRRPFCCRSLPDKDKITLIRENAGTVVCLTQGIRLQGHDPAQSKEQLSQKRPALVTKGNAFCPLTILYSVLF